MNANLSSLLSALFGGALAVAGGWSQAEYYRRKSLRGMRTAIAAEIASLVWIGRTNNFAGALRLRAANLRIPGMEIRNNGNTWDAFSIVADKNYFAVFEQNANRLGELEPDLAGKVVAFYQASRSWLDTVSKENADDRTNLDLKVAADLDDLIATRLENLTQLGSNIVRDLTNGKVANTIEEMISELITSPEAAKA